MNDSDIQDFVQVIQNYANLKGMDFPEFIACLCSIIAGSLEKEGYSKEFLQKICNAMIADYCKVGVSSEFGL